MMIDLKKNQKSNYLRMIWCLLALWIFWQFGTAMIRSAFLPRRVQKTLEHYKESPKKNNQMQSSRTEHAQEPKSMFAQQKVEMPKCLAVLGDEALINEQWYKVGSTVGGAKIVAINSKSVKILWEEKEHALVPFDVAVQYAVQTAGPKGMSEAPKSAAPPGSGAPGRGTFGNDGPRGPGMISSDERRQMYERYQNASPEEQEKMRQQMRERFGGRGRGQRGGRSGRSGN